MIKIFASDCSRISPLQYEVLLKKVSNQRQFKVSRYRQQGDRELSVCAELLVRYAYSKLFGKSADELRFCMSRSNKPYISNVDNFHFNISHSGIWCICAVSRSAIGVDIERINLDVDIEIAQHFFHPKEQLSIQGEESQIDLFFRYWTAKESYVKYLGIGMALPFKTFFCDDGIIYHGERSKSKIQYSYSIPKYLIAICCATDEFVDNDIHFVDVTKLMSL